MKKIHFTKMQGTGNDYIYVDCLQEAVFSLDEAETFSKRFSDRHFGIGSDGLILIKPSQKADFFMDMYNADGSRGKMCGNGIRCVAKYVFDHGLIEKNTFTIETLSGIREVSLELVAGKVQRVTVNMGCPIFTPSEVPVLWSGKDMINQPVAVNGSLYNMTVLSMGNPHGVVYVRDIEKLPLETIGPLFEKHRLFPQGINTEFVEIIDDRHLRMRVWERGSGETMACGTGACATVVASVLNRFSQRQVRVMVNGGELDIHWREEDNAVIMTGAAEWVFSGDVFF